MVTIIIDSRRFCLNYFDELRRTHSRIQNGRDVAQMKIRFFQCLQLGIETLDNKTLI